MKTLLRVAAFAPSTAFFARTLAFEVAVLLTEGATAERV